MKIVTLSLLLYIQFAYNYLIPLFLFFASVVILFGLNRLRVFSFRPYIAAGTNERGLAR